MGRVCCTHGTLDGWGAILDGGKIFLFSTASRSTPGPSQPPIQCVRGVLSSGLKRPGIEVDHSPPSSVHILHGVVLN
jgi:hypothetical protein